MQPYHFRLSFFPGSPSQPYASSIKNSLSPILLPIYSLEHDKLPLASFLNKIESFPTLYQKPSSVESYTSASVSQF